MRTLKLNDLKFEKPQVISYLQKYLMNCSKYNGFDINQTIFIYSRVLSNDFIAFESKDFNISFLSSAYKPSTLFINENIQITECSLQEFFNYICKVA